MKGLTRVCPCTVARARFLSRPLRVHGGHDLRGDLRGSLEDFGQACLQATNVMATHRNIALARIVVFIRTLAQRTHTAAAAV